MHVASRTDLGDIDYGGFVTNAVNNAKAPNAAASLPRAATERTKITSIGILRHLVQNSGAPTLRVCVGSFQISLRLAR